MWVDSKKKQIKLLKLIMKDGSIQVFEMQKFEPNIVFNDALFKYDTKGLKPEQINDERE
jgi:outer membrane lipoprotein-sorting protein